MERCFWAKRLYEKRNELFCEGRHTESLDELIMKIIDAKGGYGEYCKAAECVYSTHPFDPSDNDCETILYQLNQAYAESLESDPTQIRDGFKELGDFLGDLSLDDNNAV